MRTNLSHFYFKSLHIKTELFILMYSPIELKLSIKLPDGRRSLSNEKNKLSLLLFIFFWMAWRSSFRPPSSKQVPVLISVRKKSFRKKIWEVFAYYSRAETSYEAFLMEFRNKNHRHFQSLSNKTMTSDFRVTMWLAFSQKSRNCLPNLDTL